MVQPLCQLLGFAMLMLQRLPLEQAHTPTQLKSNQPPAKPALSPQPAKAEQHDLKPINQDML